MSIVRVRIVLAWIAIAIPSITAVAEDVPDHLTAQDTRRMEVAEKVGKCVVPILRLKEDGEYEGYGTAFFIHEDGILATARHCIMDGKKSPPVVWNNVAIFLDGEYVRCEVLDCGISCKQETAIVHMWDLAVVRVADPSGPYSCLQLRDKALVRVAEPVAMVGFLDKGSTPVLGGNKADNTPHYTLGVVSCANMISTVDDRMGSKFGLDIAAAEGSSGGPVFEPCTGRVLGVQTEVNGRRIPIRTRNGLEVHKIPFGIAYAEPASPLAWWLSKHHALPRTPSRP